MQVYKHCNQVSVFHDVGRFPLTDGHGNVPSPKGDQGRLADSYSSAGSSAEAETKSCNRRRYRIRHDSPPIFLLGQFPENLVVNTELK